MAASLAFVKRIRNTVEYRYDPLTRHETRINPARARRPKQGESDDKGLLEIVAKSREACVFCPERIAEKVPRFEAALGLEGGRVRVGQTLLFPNLNPFGEGHAVAVCSDAHYLPPAQLAAPLVRDALQASVAYFQASLRAAPRQAYPTLVWNYLPPSAGSIIHPHLQMMMEESPTPAVEALLAQAAEYARVHGRNYWTDLAAAEAAHRERYIGQVGAVQVLASYAPRGMNEVLLLVPGVASLAQLSPAQQADLAEALSRLLRGYESALGVGSFNLVSFSGPAPAPASASVSDHSFTLHFKLFSRPAPRGLYTNDTGPMERMYDAWVIDALPERVAEALAPFVTAEPSK